jgi:hypothetical protein
MNRIPELLALVVGGALAWLLFEPIMTARARVPVVGDMPPLQLAALVAGVLVGLIVWPWLMRRRR